MWIARQTGKHGFEKLVALKTILPQFSRDPRFRRMFLDEAHIAAGIDHPNVAHILDLGEQHDLLYIVMEYVDGDALSRLSRNLGKKGLTVPPAIALRILADACAGLHAAHELRGREGDLLGIVHRDVSPQNLLVSVKGTSKLIDFGVAKARDRLGDDGHTLHGKIQYMAPEQAMGKEIDRRADVWAIGAILHSLLAGAAPYEGENQVHSLQMLTSGKPPPPLPQWVPPPVAELVRQVLTHDPKRRIPNAHELQMEIEGVMAATGLRATHADVAELMREHLSDRTEKRRSSIDLALQAATERARVAKLLPMPAPEGMSDLIDLRIPAHAGYASVSLAASSAPMAAASPTLEYEPVPRSRGWIVGLAVAATLVSVGVASVLANRTSVPTVVVPPEEKPGGATPAKTTELPVPVPVIETAAVTASAAAPKTAIAAPTPAKPATGASTTTKPTATAPAAVTAAVTAAATAPATATAAKPTGKPKTPDDGF